MYVIQVSGTTADTQIGKTTTNTVLVPAEKCTWEVTYSDTDKDYNISGVNFYSGHAAGAALNASNTYQLGYIGKSGRFVEIA